MLNIHFDNIAWIQDKYFVNFPGIRSHTGFINGLCCYIVIRTGNNPGGYHGEEGKNGGTGKSAG